MKAGGRYRMDEGQIVVDSIVPISLSDITHDLARESGFSSVSDLLADSEARQRRQRLPDSVPLHTSGWLGRAEGRTAVNARQSLVRGAA